MKRSAHANDPRPGLPAAHWTITDNVHHSGSSGSSGQFALDGNPATQWSTDRPMRAGDQVTLDMGAPQRIGRVALLVGETANSSPRSFAAEASTDGRAWRPLLRESPDETLAGPRDGVINVVFPPTSARYLRVTNQTDADAPWSITEFCVYGPPRYSAQVKAADGGWGRMIRLNDGNWLAVATHYPSRTTHILQLRISTDGARTWTTLSQVVDPGRKLDNGDLIQLPDGSVLLAARSLIDDESYHLPVYISRNAGRSWDFLSMIDKNDAIVNGNRPSQGLWEPHFFLLPAGDLGVAYANEKHSTETPPFSQVCSERVSRDRGATWGPEIRMVSEPGGGSLRPGMPVVTRMQNGAYIEVSEVVGIHHAAVFAKISPDGVTWPPGIGSRVRLQHAGPWVTSLADGRLAVTSCSNEVSYSRDFGQTWTHDTAPPWDVGFVYSWPAIYETAPGEMAFMNTFHGINIRFQREPR